MKFTLFTCTIQWVLVYSQCCEITTIIQLQNIVTAPKDTLRPLAVSPIPHFPAPETINLSVSVDLPILDIAYRWDHTICNLSCLAYFP